ncbi:hypothetical protein J2S43_004588 [Catenuloplanes nepalensis]|uniref:Uncharacterized protein n=1 Tax=Catenuloplanes nepalensis TaxID=587533 RepID=A0ABT9MXB3_9ACTN|nr:hypothetical protein [Catenuloplanes nepalensis]MDP9796076.1 hypothetical protein [Catenuloplanes nepalensis]
MQQHAELLHVVRRSGRTLTGRAPGEPADPGVGDPYLSGFGQQHVARFEAAVRDAPLVRRGQRVRARRRDHERLRDRHRPVPGQPAPQVDAADQLGDERDRVVLRDHLGDRDPGRVHPVAEHRRVP